MRLSSNYLQTISRVYERQAMQYAQLLMEMNVSNLDDLKVRFTAMLDQAIANRGVTVASTVHDMIIKRAIKAMGNDDAGNMTKKVPVAPKDAPQNAPGWLRVAFERGDEVWQLDFKDGFEARLAHVVDWIAADDTAARTIKAAPELDFLGHLGVAADTYFARQSQEIAKQEPIVEEGRVVVMTFRLDSTTGKQIPYQEDNLEANEHGPVTAFWCRLDSAAALNREGKLMGHCVGSYAKMVEAEEVIIYSLRDPKNQPHATVELNQRRKPPTINQIKGKGNQPPVGKYAGYIRDFLNTMGVRASSGGATDLEGLGLLTHNGKYGTILDVGGNVVQTFENGDSLRYLDSAQDKHFQVLRFLYVERDGTVPFQFTVDAETKKRTSSLKMFRKETSRFLSYQKNLIALFNQDKMKSDRDVFEIIGVFFDPIKGLWGTKDDLFERMMDYKGFEISRFGNDLWFFDGKVLAVTFTFYGQSLTVPSRMKVKNETPGFKNLPEVFKAFIEKFIADEDFSLSDLDNEEKDMLYRFGLFPRKSGLSTVPEKNQIFQSSHGSIRHYQHRFYFYNKAGSLLGTTYLGQTGRYVVIDLSKLDAFGNDNMRPMLQILVDITKDESNHVSVKMNAYEHRKIVENGFSVMNGKLIPISEIEKEKPIKGGYTVEIKASDSKGRKITVKKGDQDIIGAEIDEQSRVERLWASGEDYKSSTIGLLKYNAQVADMLNIAKAVMRRRDMLMYFINEKNGKFVPVTDPVLLNFMKVGEGKVDLGNGFIFIIHGSYRLPRKDDDNRWSNHRYGRIEHKDNTYHTIVEVQFTDDQKDELAYHMSRQALDQDTKITRDDVIKACATLMRLYHAKVEPYLSSAWVGPGPMPTRYDEE